MSHLHPCVDISFSHFRLKIMSTLFYFRSIAMISRCEHLKKFFRFAKFASNNDLIISLKNLRNVALVNSCARPCV